MMLRKRWLLCAVCLLLTRFLFETVQFGLMDMTNVLHQMNSPSQGPPLPLSVHPEHNNAINDSTPMGGFAKDNQRPPRVKQSPHTELYTTLHTMLYNTHTCKTYTPEIDPYEKDGPIRDAPQTSVAHNGTGTGLAAQREGDSGAEYKSCSTLHFNTSKRLPLVALTSAPGSGNTWTRHLIQQLTGIYTGAIYNDRVLKKAGFLGEFRVDRTVVAIKTHRVWKWKPKPKPQPKPQPPYEKAILLLRDPHEAVIAEFIRQLAGHTGTVNISAFYSPRWNNTAPKLARSWYTHFESWSRFDNSTDMQGCLLLVVSFAHLRTSLRQELIGIGKFLGVKSEYLQGKHLDCVVRNSDGKFKRSKKERPPSDIFTANMNATIAKYMAKVNAKLTDINAGFTV